MKHRTDLPVRAHVRERAQTRTRSRVVSFATVAAGAVLLAACSGSAAPTPQIVYVTPQPTMTATPTLAPTATPTVAPTPRPTIAPTERPTPVPTAALATSGILGEPLSALIATLEPLGYTFAVDSGPNGEPARLGTSADGSTQFFFVNDPVTAMVFQQTGSGNGIKAAVDLFVEHARSDAIVWVTDRLSTVATTGRLVTDSKVLDDGAVVTVKAEMSGSDIMVTVTLQPQ